MIRPSFFYLDYIYFKFDGVRILQNLIFFSKLYYSSHSIWNFLPWLNKIASFTKKGKQGSNKICLRTNFVTAKIWRFSPERMIAFSNVNEKHFLLETLVLSLWNAIQRVRLFARKVNNKWTLYVCALSMTTCRSRLKQKE